jgi:hypothetical protein
LKKLACVLAAALTMLTCSAPGGGGTDGGATGGGGGGSGALGGGMSGTGGGGTDRVPVTGRIVDVTSKAPIASATVFLADDPSITTDTDSDGGFTLMVPPLTNKFIHAEATDYKDSNQGVYVQPDGGGGANFEMGMMRFEDYATICHQLMPQLNANSVNGVLVIDIQDQGTLIPGAFSAELSQAPFGSFTFSPDSGMPCWSDAGFDGEPFFFVGLDGGSTTTITLHPPAGVSCAFEPPFTDWLIEGTTFTHAIARCH